MIIIHFLFHDCIIGVYIYSLYTLNTKILQDYCILNLLNKLKNLNFLLNFKCTKWFTSSFIKLGTETRYKHNAT